MAYKITLNKKQDNLIENIGEVRARGLYNIFKSTYPKYCSIPYGEEMPREHTKEEVFIEEAKKQGYTNKEIKSFLQFQK